jgi:membrane protein DedA with SNARE-associated domain
VPEEIILTAAGYISYVGHAKIWWAGLSCALGVLLGDLIPFSLGRLFGPRILRIRPVRAFVSRRGLGNFDKWFQRQGYKALLIARFLPGMRTAAFFTAGALKLGMLRFLSIDGLGIALVTPTFVWLGFHFGPEIKSLYQHIRRAEAWLLWTVVGVALVLFVAWRWRQRKIRIARERELRDTYVEPTPKKSLSDSSSGDVRIEPPKPGP